MYWFVWGCEGPLDRSQNMGPNFGNLLELGWTVQSLLGLLVLKLCVKMYALYEKGQEWP